MSPSRLVSHILLDTVADWGSEPPANRLEALSRAADRLQDADAVALTITHDEYEGGIEVGCDCAALATGAIDPMHFLARELAEVTGRSVLDIVDDARAWIDRSMR